MRVLAGAILQRRQTERAAARSDRPAAARGVTLGPLRRTMSGQGVEHSLVSVGIDRARKVATVTVRGPEGPPPASAEGLAAEGDAYWRLRLVRERDDALLHLRFNELSVGVILFKSVGDPGAVLAHDAFLAARAGDWLAREIALCWRRVMKRLDVTSRSLMKPICEPRPRSASTTSPATSNTSASRPDARDPAPPIG